MKLKIPVPPKMFKLKICIPPVMFKVEKPIPPVMFKLKKKHFDPYYLSWSNFKNRYRLSGEKQNRDPMVCYTLYYRPNSDI